MKNKKDEEFFYNVIRDFGHQGWRLEWYKDDSSEGYCWLNSKKINIGPASKNIRCLMLHEIAHIDTCLSHGNKHKKEFWQRYDMLLEKYLPGTELSESEKYHRKLNE